MDSLDSIGAVAAESGESSASEEATVSREITATMTKGPAWILSPTFNSTKEIRSLLTNVPLRLELATINPLPPVSSRKKCCRDTVGWPSTWSHDRCRPKLSRGFRPSTSRDRLWLSPGPAIIFRKRGACIRGPCSSVRQPGPAGVVHFKHDPDSRADSAACGESPRPQIRNNDKS